jgi:hypothetical protein
MSGEKGVDKPPPRWVLTDVIPPVPNDFIAGRTTYCIVIQSTPTSIKKHIKAKNPDIMIIFFIFLEWSFLV